MTTITGRECPGGCIPEPNPNTGKDREPEQASITAPFLEQLSALA